MEEAERRNEIDANKATPILRICENHFSVQMASLRKKVSSSSDTNNPIIVLALASSPSINRIKGPILSFSVGDVAPVVSPYFSKNPSCILNVNSINCDDINVDHKRNGVLKSKAMKRGRENVGVSGDDGGAQKRNEVLKSKRIKRRKKDVGYGEVLSVQEREIKEMEQEKQHVGETILSIGVSLGVESSDVKKKGNYGTEIREQHNKEEKLSGVNPVIVLALASPSISRIKASQLAQNYSPLNPILNYNVGDGNRVVSPYFSKKNSSSLSCILNVNSMNCEGMNVGSLSSDNMRNDDGQKRNEMLKSKRRKKRKDVGYVKVLSVEQSLFKERGIEVNCSEMEQDKQHVGETNLSTKVSVVKHKYKSQDLGIEKDADFLRLNVLPKGKRSDKRRENARTGEVLGIESNDMEKKEKYGTEKGEGHIKDENLSSVIQEMHKNVDIMPENVILKGKRSNQTEERKIRTSGVTMSDEDTRVFSPYFSKMDDGPGGTMSDGNEQLKKKKKKKRKMKKTAENDRACNELEREAPRVMPSIGDSPYFLADRANDYEKSKSESMEKGEEKKVKKGRKIKENRTGLESASMESRKEDCIYNNQRCPQASTSLNVCTDFQKLPVNEKKEDQRDELYCKIHSKRRIDKAALKAFDQLLSNYAYKSDSMNDEGDNDEVSGKLEGKKQRRGIAKATLTREEKFAEAYRRKAPNNTWKPPSSPYNLLQEDHSHDPWRVLVICMLLNITTGPQVRKVLSLFFQLCPNAEAALSTNEIEIARVIETLGLHRKRAAMIKRLSREYLSRDWSYVTQLHGIGKYAADAYAMFCNGMWDQVTPNDHMLNYYWKYLHKKRPCS